MKILFSIFAAALWLAFSVSPLYAISPFGGETEQQFCDRCNGMGSSCQCSVGVPKTEWDCDCRGMSRMHEGMTRDTAASSSQGNSSGNSSPTGFMDNMHQSMNMPHHTGMGMEVEKDKGSQ